MSGDWPENIQHRLEQTLTQWRHWHCEPALETVPQVSEFLGRGTSNYSFRVGGERQYVVRIDGINPSSIGLNRRAEWRTLEDASARGLAPRPRYLNPDLGSLVCDYLPPDADQPAALEPVGTLLRGIHGLPARHYRLDLEERIGRHEKQLAHRGERLPAALVELRPQVQACLGRVGNPRAPVVLCHNDLLRANRTYSGGQLWALDWEYCAMGSPWYDLAVVCCGDELDESSWQNLLRAYLQRPAGEEEMKRLLEYGVIYRYLELLWYLALEKAPPETAFFEGRAGRLAAACDSLPG